MGQVWRGGTGRQAVDAALVALARDGDEILTSDIGDLAPLAAGAGVHVELVPA